MTAPVTTIIVAYRNAGDVLACLKALGTQTHTGFAVHVCENGGDDAFAALLRVAMNLGFRVVEERQAEKKLHRSVSMTSAQMPFALTLHLASENLGYAGAINAVLSATETGGDVWILNPDTEPQPGALSALQARAHMANCGIVGGRLIMRENGRVQLDGGRWRKWIARGFNINFNAAADCVVASADVEAAMDYVSGACMYVTRDFIKAIGSMDDRYFLYAEEVDWCMRRQNFRLGFAQEAVIIHGHGTTTGAGGTLATRSALSVYLEHRNKQLLTRKHFPAAWPVIALITLALTGEYLVKGAPRNFFVALAGWWHGLLGRTGRPEHIPFGGANRGWPSKTS